MKYLVQPKIIWHALLKQAYLICKTLMSPTKKWLIRLIKERANILYTVYTAKETAERLRFREDGTQDFLSLHARTETQSMIAFTHWTVSSDWVLVEAGVAIVSAPPSCPFPLGSALISADARSMTWTMGIYSRSYRRPSAEIPARISSSSEIPAGNSGYTSL